MRLVLMVAAAAVMAGCAMTPEQQERLQQLQMGLAAGYYGGMAARPAPPPQQPLPIPWTQTCRSHWVGNQLVTACD